MLFALAQAAAVEGPPVAEVGINPQVWLYAGFIAVVVTLLLLDLFVFHRHAHVIPMKEAIGWSIFWVSLSLLFSVAVYYIYDHHWLGIGIDVPQLNGDPRDVGGKDAMQLYLIGYLIEQSLSMDNLFVIALIFGFFRIPPELQHRVLFWGILTAVVLRGVMIAIGAALIHNFEWIVYVFGGFLVFTAIKMALNHDNDQIDPEKSFAVRIVRKFFPVTSTFHGSHFLTREAAGFEGKLVATPLLLALLLVETTDVVFAVDSIPAIFGITADPFIVFTSNIFAILGLRSLFFCLAALLTKFHYLKYALIIILAFVGVKMLIVDLWHIPTGISLGVVLGLLALGVVVSLLRPLPVQPEDAPPGTLPRD